jgi:SAM-dependent methyltransferase
MTGAGSSGRHASDGSPMGQKDHEHQVGGSAHGHQDEGAARGHQDEGSGRRHHHGAGRGQGNEFEGVLGLLCGLTMAFGRGRSARLVADATGVGPGDRVVDVGCGPGRFLREAAERGAEAVGVEPSSQMRRLASWRTPASLREVVTVVEGTAERLPLDDRSATVACAVASLHHWADPDAGLAELRRVLRPGGRLLIAERLARPGGWLQHHALGWEGAERLAAKAERAGFTDVTVTREARGRHQLVLVKGYQPADPA